MSNTDKPSPLILAFDTSTEVCSVAVFKGKRLLAHTDYHVPKAHARILIPLIDRLLKGLELQPAELDAIAVCKGPGSYTGLRVGVSSAKGLCLALNKALLSFDTLEALALQVQDLAKALGAKICPMIDARRMEVFTTLYSPTLETLQATHALIVTEASIKELVGDNKVIFVGDGVQKCIDVLATLPKAIALPQIVSGTAQLGNLLYDRWEKASVEDLQTFEPYYLKDFVATQAKDKFA